MKSLKKTHSNKHGNIDFNLEIAYSYTKNKRRF